jgi:hypothetical protein
VVSWDAPGHTYTSQHLLRVDQCGAHVSSERPTVIVVRDSPSRHADGAQPLHNVHLHHMLTNIPRTLCRPRLAILAPGRMSAISAIRCLHQSPRPQPSAEPKSPESDSHTADMYLKDVDVTPPEDPKIHRVDAASESAQKPHEAPSGKFSRAGTETKDYEGKESH